MHAWMPRNKINFLQQLLFYFTCADGLMVEVKVKVVTSNPTKHVQKVSIPTFPIRFISRPNSRCNLNSTIINWST